MSINEKWKVVVSGSEAGNALRVEDTSIFTESDSEVLGCSEWLRCDVETLKYICDLHNKALEANNG